MTLSELLSVWDEFYSSNGYGGIGIIGETGNEWVLQGKHENDLGELPQPIIVNKENGAARWCYMPHKSDRDILYAAEKNLITIK